MSTEPWAIQIPPFSYSLPSNVYKSFCIAIERDNDPYAILLPVAEAIRFYYAPSSDLAHVMFSGQLQLSPDHVYDTKLSGKLVSSERMVVSRVQWLADNDCWIIGRILGDANARAGAKRIYDSLAKATANRMVAFPECNLPFCGEANWRVRAVPIGSSREEQRWLILEIERCSAAFPFEELEVVAANDARRADAATDIPDDQKHEGWRSRREQPVIDPADLLQSTEAPQANLRPVVLTNPGAYFDALQDKGVIKTPKSECHYKGEQLHSVSPLGEDIGTGDGIHGDGRVKPGKVVWGRQEEEHPKQSRRKFLGASFDVIYDVVDAINAEDGRHASVRDSKALTYIPLVDQRSRQWSWLDSSEKLRRESLIVDLMIAGQHACLVEFQQRRKEHCALGLIVYDDWPRLDDVELQALLRLLAQRKGVWSNVKCPYDGVKIVSIRHTKPTAADLAKTVVDKVSSAGNQP